MPSVDIYKFVVLIIGKIIESCARQSQPNRHSRRGLTILTKTISFTTISLILSHHTGISDILRLASSDSLASPHSIQEEQDNHLDADTS